MKKSLLLALPATLLAITLLVYFDSGLARWLANQFLRSQSIEITCLDYEITLSGQINAQTLCISLPSAKVVANDLKVKNWGNQVHAEQVEIKLEESGASHSQEPMVLPVELPRISINKATLILDEHLPAIPLAIQSKSDSEIVIESQWRLFISLKERKAIAQLDWKPEDFKPWLPSSYFAAIPQSMLAKPMTTKIEFNGSTLNILQPIELEHTQETEKCTVGFKSIGELYVSIKTQDLSAKVDASNLLTEVQIDSCEMFPKLVESDDKLKLNLVIPEHIEWENQQLAIPKIVLHSEDKFHLSAALNDTQYRIDDGLTSTFLLRANESDNTEFTSSGKISLNDGKFSVDKGLAELRVTRIAYNELSFDTIALSSSFVLANSKDAKAKVEMEIGKMQKGGCTAQRISTDATFESQGLSNWNITLQSNLSSLSDEFIEAKNVMSELTGILTNNELMQLIGTTIIDDFAVNQINTGSFKIAHEIEHQLSSAMHFSRHGISSSEGLSADMKVDSQVLDITLPAQSFGQFNKVIKQQFPDANILKGQWQGNVQYNLTDQTLAGMLDIMNMDLEYGTYTVKALSFSPTFNIDSAGLQLTPTRLFVDTLFTGIPIVNFESEISSQDSDLIAQSIKAELLGGEFSVPKLGLHQNEQQIDLQFDRIDIATLLQIQEAAGVQGPGIRVTGKIGGSIPLAVKDNTISVDQGKLVNLGPGWLRIEGNTVFESLKASQPEISGQLSVLENLNFDTLTSDISMQPDGLVKMSMQIKGANPDVNQDIVFNYNHEQNLFTLLKSIRLSQDIQEKVNEALSTGKDP